MVSGLTEKKHQSGSDCGMHGPLTSTDPFPKGTHYVNNHNDDECYAIHDISVKAGNRLYSQAIERLRRHKEKRSGPAGSSQSSFDERKSDSDSLDCREDTSTRAGNRLYTQALERKKRHDALRSEVSSVETTYDECSSETLEERQDLSTRAGNRLYTQAIERSRRHEAMRTDVPGDNDQYSREASEFSELSETYDVSIKAGNRLYIQAIERLRRHEAKRSNGNSVEDMKQSSYDNAYDDRDDLDEHPDLSVKAGNRLYIQAVEQQRRQEAKRLEASKPKAPKLEMATQLSGKSLLSTDSKNSQDSVERFDHLYHLSSEKQLLGKQRRFLIEEEKVRARELPESKILPASQAGNMYSRGMERLIAQKIKLAEKAAALENNEY